MTMDRIAGWGIGLHIGIFVLLIPLYAVEYPAMNNRTFWKGFARGMPKWVFGGIQVLALFFAVHFVLFLVQSHGAAPEIKDGQYVLNNHGNIVKRLTQSEYDELKGAELRLFATGWIAFYAPLAAYWWFPRRQRTTNN